MILSYRHTCKPFTIKKKKNVITTKSLKTSMQIQHDIRIQYLSDIHLEKNIAPKLEKTGDYLVLAGDIGCPFEDYYTDFLHDLSMKYDKIFLIPGNHEYFTHNMNATNLQMTMISSYINNLVILNNTVYDLCDDLRIIGTPLWTNMDHMTSMHISDFTKIKTDTRNYMTVKTHRNLHKQSKEFIENQMDEAIINTKQLIVVTHHAPHNNMLGDIYRNALNRSAYATDLSDYFKDPIILWICGHTHQNVKTFINGIPCVSNCYGTTEEENNQFDPKARITLRRM